MNHRYEKHFMNVSPRLDENGIGSVIYVVQKREKDIMASPMYEGFKLRPRLVEVGL